MFNVTIINAKKSIIRISIVIIFIILVFVATQIIDQFSANEVMMINISEELIKCLNCEIPAIVSINYEANKTAKEYEDEEKSFSKKILNMELAKIENKKEIEKIEVENSGVQISEESENSNIENIQEISENLETEIVTKNPITESYNIEYNGIKIKNETEFNISNDIFEQKTNINKENIIIFHTHTCESYTPTENCNYQQTGNYRTTDLNYSVARVGDELTENLKKYGFNVIHDKTYHDYPAYTGSYTRSNTTVENILKTSPSDIIIDLHRDAIGSKSDYDPSVKIGEDVSAQLMFVIGTNGGGLYHPDWQSNLKFAVEIQQKANEMYPGLFKPIILRNSRYNQHLGKSACIIEVGATGNTLEQCLNSMKYLANVLEEFKENK